MKWYTKLSAALEYLAIGTVDYNHTKVDVGDSSTQILAANADRKYALFINNSDEDIYMKADGAAAVVGRGIVLKADGGSFEMSPRLGNLTTSAVRGIHNDTGNKGLLVVEGE